MNAHSVFQDLRNAGLSLAFLLLMTYVAVLSAQTGLIQVAAGPGFSALRMAPDGSGGFVVQGTIPEYLEWDGRLVAGNDNEDLVFLRLNEKGGLLWSKVFGSRGSERITSAPLVSPGQDAWAFFGEAVDSLRLGNYGYRPAINSFFQFAGWMDQDGGIRSVRAMESSAPVVISASAWSEDGQVLYLAGTAESPVLSAGDTLLSVPDGRSGFVLAIDRDWNVLHARLIPGDVVFFDLTVSNGHIVCGMNIRDTVWLDGLPVIARVQDRDCLVASWREDLGPLIWHHKLGGVYEKTGMRLLVSPGNGDIYASGHYIGAIGDGSGHDFESRGFEPDLFVWQFDADGQILAAHSEGSAGPEWLADAIILNDRLYFLVGFSARLEAFGQKYDPPISGMHTALLSIGTDWQGDISQILLGQPNMIGYDLFPQNAGIGIWGGFSEEVRDTLLGRYASRIGTGYFDYLMSFAGTGVGADTRSMDLPLEVYPNPANGTLWVESPEPLCPAPWIEILDIRSRLLFRVDRSPVDVHHLSPGLYFVRTPCGVRSFLKI